MAVSVSVYDLENYPDNPKTMTVDQKTIVPVGYEGDEQWVMSFATNATAEGSTSIQDIYVREFRAGWYKSSGLVGTGGRFTLVSGASYQLNVKMDNSAGATGNGGYYTISLEPGTNVAGEAIAEDMEEKIRALPDGGTWNSSDDGYKLSYINCSVEYTNGKFWIVSGSMSAYYTGAYRSSVDVAQSGSDTSYSTLGFDLGISSQDMASVDPKESLVTSSYTVGDAALTIGAGTGVSEGDVFMVTDGTNSDYCVALSGTTDTSVAVPVSGTNGFNGISNNYTANQAKIQLLRPQDPDQVPAIYHNSYDKLVRWGIKSIANQIDFS